MPGGTGGPHRIQGVGFWAQKPFYNIAPYNPGPFIFRPPLKGLPEQPFPPNAFQSWTYSYNLNLIGRDRFPTGEAIYDRPQLATVPVPPFWSQSLIPVLFMQPPGQPLVGGMWDLLPPAHFIRPPLNVGWLQSTTALTFPVPPVTNAVFRGVWKSLPEQPSRPDFTWLESGNALFAAVTVALPPGLGPTNQEDWPNPQQPWRLDQTWTRSYNLNLIGQDRMLVGEQRYELTPSQVAPDQIQLRSWQWSYNLSLVGKDRLPSGEQTYDLTVGQRPPEQIQLHSWSWQYNLNLIGKDQLITGEQVTDLPPRDPREVRAWSWQYNLNLIGQDRMATGEQVWERPTLSIPPSAPTWAWQYNPNLIGQDFLPFRQRDWPLPIAPQQPALSWTDPVKIWLTVPTLNITISQYWDRPQLPVLPAQTWSWSYNLNLIGQDHMLTGEQVTDLPPRDFSRLFQTWINSVNAALVTAPANLYAQARQQDWPIPRGAEPDYRRSWEWQYNKTLIGQDQLPFRQTDWPNPVAPVQVQGWIDQTKILLAQPAGPLGTIANQFDWPLPQRQPQQVQTWTNTITALILGAKPFAQTDWPNPTPFARDPTLTTIAASYNKNLIGADRLPNRQQDWPLSSAHALSQIPLQIMVQGKWFNLVPPTPLGLPLTSGRLFDRPQLRLDSAADIAWPAWRWPQITPPPVSAIVPLRTLMGTGV
jgi:hypothetical protein